jgi:hypothetical protein
MPSRTIRAAAMALGAVLLIAGATFATLRNDQSSQPTPSAGVQRDESEASESPEGSESPEASESPDGFGEDEDDAASSAEPSDDSTDDVEDESDDASESPEASDESDDD